MLIEVMTKVVMPLLTVVIVYILAPYIYEKTTAKERENIYFYIKVAVQAAEQLFNYNNAGKAKKEYVLDYIKKKELDISEEDLDVMIEAAVQELNIIKERVG